MEKTIFLQRLQEERDRFELLLNRAGFHRVMTLRGVSRGLSIKDRLSDVLTRGQYLADRLSEIRHGVRHSPCTSAAGLEAFRREHGFPDYESSLVARRGPDPAVIERYRGIGLDEIVALDLVAYTNIVSGLQSLTIEQCRSHDLFHRAAELTLRPYRRLRLDIRHWIDGIALEL